MGLDITAYSNLRAVGQHTDGWCEEANHVNAYAYSSFPDSFRGIPILTTEGQFIKGGCYEYTGDTKWFSFHAGSYTGYSMRREALANRFNPDMDPAKPFGELVWFADNEGCIGPEAARDLLADFRDNAEAALPDLDEYDFYSNFWHACELAAENGLIDFH